MGKRMSTKKHAKSKDIQNNNNKDLYFFDKFLKQFEFKKSLDKYNQFLNFLSYKYSLDFNKLTSDLDEFVKEEKDNLFVTTLDDEFKTYVDTNEEKLQTQYNEICGFQTNTRGVKIRGVFPSQEEAEMRCKALREMDPNHDVYVGSVGLWLPFHPEAYKTGKVEYLENELNELMSQKKKNDEVSKEEFTKRVKDSKKKAIEENIAKATKEGNKLMQSIDEEGNLINADRMDVPGKNLLFGDGKDDSVSTANLRNELFNSEDVILDKNNDRGLSELLQRQKEREIEKQKQKKEEDEDLKEDLKEDKEDLKEDLKED